MLSRRSFLFRNLVQFWTSLLPLLEDEVSSDTRSSNDDATENQFRSSHNNKTKMSTPLTQGPSNSQNGSVSCLSSPRRGRSGKKGGDGDWKSLRLL